MSIKKFKSWQKKPIEYMTQKCINNDGIFLFHHMGTGKSLTALGLAHNIGLPYLVICPEALINQWNQDYIKIYQKYLPTNIGIMSYSQAGDFLKNKNVKWLSKITLIMDEAHNYSKYINILPLKKLQLFKKRVLLSATPFYHSSSDIAGIINIVSGTNVFPIDPKVFKEKYYRLNTTKSIIYGGIYNNLQNLKFISEKSMTILAVNTLIQNIFFENSSPLLLSLIENTATCIIQLISDPLVKIIKYFSGINDFNDAPKLAFLFILSVTIICLVLKKIFSNGEYKNGKETYFELDINKIQKDLGSYISLYIPKKNSNDFPKINDKQIYISLNFEQVLVLMRYTILKLTCEDYLSLGIFQSYSECEDLLFDQKNYDLFLNYGRFIGNICYFKNEDGRDEYIIDKILYYNKKEYRCQLNKGYDFKLVSPKYKEIKKYSLQHSDKRIVIYTSSSLAAKTLSTYLTSTQIEHQLLLNNCSSRNFKDIFQRFYQSKTLLILDCDYYQGISFLNTNSMIFLEPINNISKNSQARARVARLNSHSPGSSIEIINLLSTMSIILQYIASIQTWLKTSKYVMYNFLYTEHNQDVTPDTIIYNKIEKLCKKNNVLVDLVKKKAIENIEIPEKCQSLKCKIGELNERSHCGLVLSSSFISKKSFKKKTSKSPIKGVNKSSRKSMTKKNN